MSFCALNVCQDDNGTLLFYLFAKVSLAFSCTLPKVTYSQNFLLTRLDFCGNLSQQLNITYFTYLFRPYGAEPFGFQPLHNRLAWPSRKSEGRAGLFCDGFFVAVLPVEPWKPHDRLHGIPGDDPARESRKTPPEGGRKAMQGERHPKFEITLIRKTRASSSDFALKFISYPLKTGTTSS